jgi:hypothetical protein
MPPGRSERNLSVLAVDVDVDDLGAFVFAELGFACVVAASETLELRAFPQNSAF